MPSIPDYYIKNMRTEAALRRLTGREAKPSRLEKRTCHMGKTTERTIQQGDLLRVDEAADVATVRPSTIWAWLTQGRLRRVKVGRCTRVLRCDLEELIRAGDGSEVAEQRAAHRRG